MAVVGLIFVVFLANILVRNSFVRNHSDFLLRWYATEKLFSEGRNIYDPANVQEIHDAAGRSGELRSNFYYPAFLLLFTAPLALLPFDLAHFLWNTTGQLFYLAGLLIVMRRAGLSWSVNRQTVVTILAVLFIPYLTHTIWSQFNTIAVFGLAMTIRELDNGRYGRAGAWSASLLFKPQSVTLTLVFLLVWALVERPRRRLLAGFGLATGALWIFAELLQPGWAGDFLDSLEGYVPVTSVFDRFWNPYQILTILVLAAAAILFVRHRRAGCGSAAFKALLVLSLAIWFLIVPVVGMLHVVTLPLMVVLIASAAGKRQRPAILATFLLIYLLGWAGFIAGNAIPGWYGRHVEFSELAYRSTAPILMTVLSIYLLLRPGARSGSLPGQESGNRSADIIG